MTQEERLSTRQLARAVGIEASSIRVHLCRKGSYFGVVPERMPNGRLVWPGDAPQRLLAQGRTTTPQITANTQPQDAMR